MGRCKFGLTEIIPFVCTLTIEDQYPVPSHSEFPQSTMSGQEVGEAGLGFGRWEVGRWEVEVRGSVGAGREV